MLTEIDKDFYCSGNNYKDGICEIDEDGECQEEDCECCHRKYPTPEEYKEEYGEEYQEGDAVYLFYSRDGIELWKVDTYSKSIKEIYANNEIVCACTPFRRPSQDWRPK